MRFKTWNNPIENEMRERPRRALRGSLYANGAVVFALLVVCLSVFGKSTNAQNTDPEFLEFLKRFPTPLLRGILTGSAPHVLGAIGRGEDVNALPGTEVERNPMLLAARGGKIEIVKLLIENKADVNATGPKGETPLLYASWAKNLELVKLLLSSGANPNALMSQTSESATLLAARMSSLEILLELIAAGGDVRVPNASGVNALMASSGDEKMIRYLLSRGFNLEDTDDEGRTALHFAVLQEQPVKLSLLLEAGIKRDTRTKDGRSATDLAATIEDKEKRREILAILGMGK